MVSTSDSDDFPESAMYETDELLELASNSDV